LQIFIFHIFYSVSTRTFGIMGCQICYNFIILWVSRSRLRKYTKHCLKKSDETFQQDTQEGKKEQSGGMCQLSRIKPNIEKITPLTPSVSTKAKFVKFGVKKANLATLASTGQLQFFSASWLRVHSGIVRFRVAMLCGNT